MCVPMTSLTGKSSCMRCCSAGLHPESKVYSDWRCDVALSASNTYESGVAASPGQCAWTGGEGVGNERPSCMRRHGNLQLTVSCMVMRKSKELCSRLALQTDGNWQVMNQQWPPHLYMQWVPEQESCHSVQTGHARMAAGWVLLEPAKACIMKGLGLSPRPLKVAVLPTMECQMPHPAQEDACMAHNATGEGCTGAVPPVLLTCCTSLGLETCKCNARHRQSSCRVSIDDTMHGRPSHQWDHTAGAVADTRH